MQTVCNTYWDAGKGNLTAQNTRKPFGGRGSVPDPARGGYSAPANTLAGGRGWLPRPQKPHPPLSTLRASPLLHPHSKISSDPLMAGVPSRPYPLWQNIRRVRAWLIERQDAFADNYRELEWHSVELIPLPGPLLSQSLYRRLRNRILWILKFPKIHEF